MPARLAASGRFRRACLVLNYLPTRPPFHVWAVRRLRERLLAALFIALDAQNLAERVKWSGGSRIEANGFFQFSKSAVQITRLLQHNSQHVMRLGVVGADREGRFHLADQWRRSHPTANM